MATISLETIHYEIVELKKEVEKLKECFHEDVLELTEKTKHDIEESRQQIKKGKFVRLENM